MTSVSHEPTLRSYLPNDTPALHEIEREFQHEVGFDPPDRMDYNDIEGVYLNDGGAFWVIEAPDGSVVAFGGVLRVDDGTARLRRFRVRRSWRRRGLATRLLQEAERFCREHGYRTIVLGTSDRQPAAQALYRKHGYVQTGEYPLGPDLREIEFAKELA